MRQFFFVCLSLLLSFSGALFASNYHEHLFSLPFKDNFYSVSPAILRVGREIPLKKVFPTETQWMEFMLEKYPQEQEKYDYWCKRSLTEFINSREKDPQEALIDLMDFDSFLGCSCPKRQIGYECIENLRKATLLALPTQEFLQIYQEYFQQEPLVNRQVVYATVSGRLFESGQLAKAKQLKKLASNFKTVLLYRVSLQRHRLISKGVQAISSAVRQQIKSKLITAVDLVASLYEQPGDYLGQERQIAEKIKELFDFIDKYQTVLYLHAFEAASEGGVYTALQKVLANYKRPLRISIGHINALTDEWLEAWKSFPSTKIHFHSCPASAYYLHGFSYQEMKKQIHKIQRKGLPVTLGSDGRGILPQSSWEELKLSMQ